MIIACVKNYGKNFPIFPDNTVAFIQFISYYFIVGVEVIRNY